MKHNYIVQVGNIGTVYNGGNARDALSIFRTYENKSINNYGRAAGECVTLLQDDEPIRDYDPAVEAAKKLPTNALKESKKNAQALGHVSDEDS